VTYTPPTSECRPNEPGAERSGAKTDAACTGRQALRREISGTIGLLTDERDFRAMRRYPSFPFDDYAAYLAGVEDLLRARASQGMHTTLALFDPEGYADFCAATGLDPDGPSSRTRFTAETAITGATIPYEGEPLAELIPVLIGAAVRKASWEYASALLARLGTCAVCGRDLGQEAFTRAQDVLTRILDTADPGHRHLVCSVSTSPDPLVSTLHADTGTEGATHLDDTQTLEFTTTLALGLASLPGGLVMRTRSPGAPDRVYGWRLRAGNLEPLTAGEVFDAYCTDVDSGAPISPESDVDYCAPPDLGKSGPTLGHHH
jgi:hypothetical protein